MSCERALSPEVMDGRPIASTDRMIWQCCNAHQPRALCSSRLAKCHRLTRSNTNRLRYGCNRVGGKTSACVGLTAFDPRSDLNRLDAGGLDHLRPLSESAGDELAGDLQLNNGPVTSRA